MTFLLIATAALVVIVILIYNMLIGRKNAVEFAFSGVDTMLKQRYDLIPNLVATCEKYMGYEQATLKAIVEARNLAMKASPEERPAREAQITAGLNGLFAVVEQYPDLKSSRQFEDLQRSLNEVEEQIAASRRAYNAAVLDYNNACQMFPTNLVAGVMGYSHRPSFEIPEAERAPVKVFRN